MAWGKFWPFIMVLCSVAGPVVCFLPGQEQAAQAEPLRSQDDHPFYGTRLDGVRPVAYVEVTDQAPDASDPVSFFAPLLAQLEKITKLNHSQAQSWATEAIAGVHELANVATGNPIEVRVACDRLDRAVHEAYLIASMKMSDREADRLRRAGYAIQRRVAVCRLLFPLDINGSGHTPTTSMTPTTSIAPATEAATVDPERLEKAVRVVEARLATDPAGKTWRQFLMLDELTDPRLKDPGGVTQRRAVVRKALAGASDVWLNEQQRAFLQTPEICELGAALRAEAAAPITRQRILELIQEYEATGLPSVAKQLADETMWLSLATSAEPVANQDRIVLRQELTNHYRNANFRLEVAESLMDRMIPPRTPELAPVHDTVLGRPVRGESLTETKVGVRFLPSEDRLTLAIDVTGEVDASTSSKSGPATFRNRSLSWYHAQKPLEITTSGLKIMPTEVLDVRNVTRLKSLRTSLDGVPIFGSLVNDVARSQHDAKQSEMRQEIRYKVTAKAKQKIETEANERLGEMAKRFEEKILQPLDHLMLGPTLVQARTTDDHLVMRVRLASVRQLGAHTMRPKAPSDSLLSFQIHESAINNAIERFKLDGQTLTVLELRQKLAAILERPDLAEKSSQHDNATITFADKDAIRVKFDEGRLRIDLAVAEIRKGSKSWHNFEVVVFYMPISDGLTTHLARDGNFRLDAGVTSFRSQVTLRGIFCTVFAKNRTIPLLPSKVASHPKMADLYLSQLELDSGWLAIALSSHEQAIAQQPNQEERH